MKRVFIEGKDVSGTRAFPDTIPFEGDVILVWNIQWSLPIRYYTG